MSYPNLQAFIHSLEQSGELIRIKDYVSPHLQIAEIADRMSKLNGKALLFENNGTKFPSISYLAKQALMSETKLKQCFKAVYKMTLYQYY